MEEELCLQSRHARPKRLLDPIKLDDRLPRLERAEQNQSKTKSLRPRDRPPRLATTIVAIQFRAKARRQFVRRPLALPTADWLPSPPVQLSKVRFEDRFFAEGELKNENQNLQRSRIKEIQAPQAS